MEAASARRNWLLAIADEKMDKDEFVWIQFESNRGGFNEMWKDTTNNPPDGRDADALRVAKKFFVMDSQPINGTEQFVADVIAKFKQPPFNCDNCTDIDPVRDKMNVGRFGEDSWSRNEHTFDQCSSRPLPRDDRKIFGCSF